MAQFAERCKLCLHRRVHVMTNYARPQPGLNTSKSSKTVCQFYASLLDIFSRMMLRSVPSSHLQGLFLCVLQSTDCFLAGIKTPQVASTIGVAVGAALKVLYD